ncbi:MAG: hypothetical protein HQM12_02315 [SAR324 cluster bacterium]|nr:hypothetical protein [SAR324 cluster bacterium]
MTLAIRLTDEELISSAQIISEIQKRTIPKQIEYWAKIGKIAEDNPNLPYEVIKDLLTGLSAIEKEGTKPLTWED